MPETVSPEHVAPFSRAAQVHNGPRTGEVEGPVMSMALVDALVVLGVVSLIGYATYAVISGTDRRNMLARSGARWEATHYAVTGSTRVVVRKVVAGTGRVLDEHVVAVIADSDSDYDAAFLEAMARARARAALFESESD